MQRPILKYKLPIFHLIIIAFFCVPIFEIKLLLLGTILIHWAIRMPNRIYISKISQIFIFNLLYSLNFILMPYWMSKPGITNITLSLLLLIIGYAVFITACIKSISLLEITKKYNHSDIISCAIIFISATVLNYYPMLNSISYRGDTDYHISTTIGLYNYLTNSYYIVFLICLISLVYWLAAPRKKLFALLFPLTIILFSIFWYYFQIKSYPAWINRYPLLFYYLNVITAVPLFSNFNQNLLLNEGNYRLLSLMCTVLIAWFATIRLNLRNVIFKCTFGIYILTIPTLRYYTSLTYIDIVMVFFAFLVIYNFDTHIKNFHKDNRINVAIIFIILLSFIKETSLIYLLCFSIFTSFIFLTQKKHNVKNEITHFLLYLLITFTPIFIYLYFRDVPHSSYHLNIENLFIPGNYKVFIVSLWEQFASLLPLSILSIIFLLIKKKSFIVFFNLSIIGAYMLFYMLNGSIINLKIEPNWIYTGTAFFGHSRFNLAFLPSCLILVISSINQMKIKSYKLLIIIFIVLSFIHSYFSPIDFLNSIRKPGWGDYTFLTSEYDFPYQEAYKWLSNYPEIKTLGIIGRTYFYTDWFYQKKFHLNLNIKQYFLDKDTDENEIVNNDYLLYHEEPKFYRPPDKRILQLLNKYHLIKTFKKSNLSLSIYKKN